MGAGRGQDQKILDCHEFGIHTRQPYRRPSHSRNPTPSHGIPRVLHGRRATRRLIYGTSPGISTTGGFPVVMGTCGATKGRLDVTSFCVDFRGERAACEQTASRESWAHASHGIGTRLEYIASRTRQRASWIQRPRHLDAPKPPSPGHTSRVKSTSRRSCRPRCGTTSSSLGR